MTLQAGKLRYQAPSQTESFLNIPGTLELLVAGETGRPRLPEVLVGEWGEVRNVILFLIDGWGWKTAFDEALPFVRRITRDKGNVVEKIQSGFPTTTTAMLSSLYLGRPPVSHGLVEWRHYEASVGRVINVLPWRFDEDHGKRETLVAAGVDPETILPRGTFFRELKEKGVTGLFVQPAELRDSTFNRFIVPDEDATTIYFTNFRQGLEDVTRALSGKGDRKLIVVYAMKYDHISHLLGPTSAGAKEALHEVLSDMEDWHDSIAGKQPGTLVGVTADHGQIGIPLTRWTNLPERVPELERYLRRDEKGHLIPMAGSARDRFAYLKEGTEAEALEVAARGLEGVADVALVKDLVARGFYGPGEPSEVFLRRMGDLCILPYDTCVTGWDGSPGKDLGHHGGLSEEELLVPWILGRVG